MRAETAPVRVPIDLRPGLVVLDTGKDRWEMDEGYAALGARDGAGPGPAFDSSTRSVQGLRSRLRALIQTSQRRGVEEGF